MVRRKLAALMLASVLCLGMCTSISATELPEQVEATVEIQMLEEAEAAEEMEEAKQLENEDESETPGQVEVAEDIEQASYTGATEEVQTDAVEETPESDFEWDGTTITKYIGDEAEVVIPSKCTKIGSNAFRNCRKVTSIIIPDSVTTIGDFAFNWCNELTSIAIPDSVTTIGKYAFNHCDKLTSITIPDSVVSISSYAFQFCSGLTSITIPDNVINIEIGILGGCIGLESIVVSDGNPYYDSRYDCNAIIEKETNTLIAGCKKTVIPDDVTIIGERAFYYCSELTDITIPSSVNEIRNDAFNGCSGLTSIVIPAGLTNIRYNVFSWCGGLESIVVSEGNPNYDSRNKCNAIIEKETNALIAGCMNTKIPNSVTTIQSNAFAGCRGLNHITIPDGVTAIDNLVFQDCSELESISIPASVTTIGYDVFYECSELKTIYGVPGSFAETYANENGYTFEEIPSAPATVTNVAAVPAGKNKVKLTWTKVDNAEGYLIYAQKNGKYAYCGMTGNTTFTDTKALDTDYNFYFVFAYVKDLDGKMLASKAVKYVYAKGVCAAVTNLKASSVTGGVKLSWTASAGADGYLIYGIVNGQKYGYVGMTSGTSYTDRKASKTQYNFYWVIPYHKTSDGKLIAGQMIVRKYTYGRAR